MGDPGAIAALGTSAGLYASILRKRTGKPWRQLQDRGDHSVYPCQHRTVPDQKRREHALDRSQSGRLEMCPVGSWDVQGGSDDPASWYVRLICSALRGVGTVFSPHSAFVHCRYSVDPSGPFRGVGPLQWASDTGILAANLEKRLGEEAGSATAFSPTDPF